MRLEGHEQEACEEHAVNRTDAGGLEDCANAGGFLAAADALHLRLGEKKVWEEGNDRFLDFHHRRGRDPDDAENRAL